MKQYVKIDPPGSWCQYEATLDIVKRLRPQTFLEIGCGAGGLSQRLCRLGLRGVGVDMSAAAIEEATHHMREYVNAGRYHLLKGNVLEMEPLAEPVDLGVSMMVMEHVATDVAFVQRIAGQVKPGGHVLIAVPGRRDRWGIEDETVGHLRRYDRVDLEDTLHQAGLKDVAVRSVAVPVANLLFYAGNGLIKRSAEIKKVELSLSEQTATSGIREIPWKTVFPPWVRIILNRVTLFPLFLLQRLFYRTNLGLTMLGVGRVAD